MPAVDDGIYRIPSNPVSSSNIAAIGYDEDRKILSVEFKAGGIFHYADVSADEAIDLVNAPSIGKHYHAQFKGKKAGQKMTGPCPNCGWTGYVGATCEDCGTAKHIDEPRKDTTDGNSEG